MSTLTAATKNELVSAVEKALRPRCFFVATDCRLRVSHEPREEIPWELLAGHLLDETKTRLRKSFESWNIHFDDSVAPVISVRYDQTEGQIHVTRNILTHVWEPYGEQRHVIQTRETQRWVPELILADIPPTAAKTGALGNAAVIEAIAERAERFSFPLVIDPVMVSKHGAPLIGDDAIDVLTKHLLPYAFLVTPNLLEAARLAAMDVVDVSSMEKAAIAISRLGAQNVLIKGGHLDGEAVDLLWTEDRAHVLTAERVDTQHTHGTGCVLSAAITARIAKGEDLVTAVKAAKQFITAAIQNNPGLGQGYGPVNMHTRTDF